jgi:hypothetical protein
VHVYHGSAAGLDAAPAWSVEGDGDHTYLAEAVGTAGDVNGDGYADLVIGTGYWGGHTPEGEQRLWGQVLVYYGSADGLSVERVWSRMGVGGWGGAFGRDAGTAGDVNGDGYADLIAGAPLSSGDLVNEGQVYVYYGSATGLPSKPGWAANGGQEGALLGHSVSTAGDVNGDGYADIAVGAKGWDGEPGAPDAGRVVLFYGSEHGPTKSSSWTAGGAYPDAQFGQPVRTAGDVNGDGYADLIVSSRGYVQPGEPTYGQADLFYGGGGPGLSLTPRQHRIAPLAHLGRATRNAFGLAAVGRTPYGRGQVKLEWEVKPFGVPFDGTDTGQSAGWVDTGTAGAALDAWVEGLDPLRPYHWRLRLRYHPAAATPQRYSRWVTAPWNGWQEQDFCAGPEMAERRYLPVVYVR